jgi:formylglycine-generating enzyme required for sulfatase activity
MSTDQTWPSDATEHDAGPEIDTELMERVSALVGAAADGDEAAGEQLTEIGEQALDRMIYAMTDTHLSVQGRARIGTLVGLMDDPRLTEPHHLGPFVRIPAGKFVMGAEPLEPEAETHALPKHDVEVPTFSITRYHVTNKAFAEFVEAGGYDDSEVWSEDGWSWRVTANATEPQFWKRAPSQPNHPVVGVCWYEAQAFCNWLTVKLGEAGELRPAETVRLPTEAEWEKAARGGRSLDRRRGRPNSMPERRYPWGDAYVVGQCNTMEAGLAATSPVGLFLEGQSPYKLEDMGGNVMDWCNSKPAAYPFDATDGREDASGGPRAYRVMRGGAWPMVNDSARCAYRHRNRAGYRGGAVGMRVVRGHEPA